MSFWIIKRETEENLFLEKLEDIKMKWNQKSFYKMKSFSNAGGFYLQEKKKKKSKEISIHASWKQTKTTKKKM